MEMGTKGNISAMTQNVIMAFLGVVILLLLAAALIPQAQYSLGNISAISGLPLGSLFTRNGIVTLIIMAFLLLGVIAGVRKIGGGKK